MYSTKAYRLKKEEFSYLLPVLQKKLLRRDEEYSFIADNSEDLEDMLNRLKGYYDYYDELKETVIYQCFKQGSIEPFKQSINK